MQAHSLVGPDSAPCTLQPALASVTSLQIQDLKYLQIFCATHLCICVCSAYYAYYAPRLTCRGCTLTTATVSVYLCLCVFCVFVSLCTYLCICVFVYAERLTGLHSARRVMSGNSCGHHQSKSSWLLTPAARQPARHSGEKPEIHTHSDRHTAVCFQKFIHLDVQLSAAVDFRIL